MFYLHDIVETHSKKPADVLLTPEALKELKAGSEVEIKGRRFKVIWEDSCTQMYGIKCLYVSCCVCPHHAKRIGEESWKKYCEEQYWEFEKAGFPRPIKEVKLKFGVKK